MYIIHFRRVTWISSVLSGRRILGFHFRCTRKTVVVATCVLLCHNNNKDITLGEADVSCIYLFLVLILKLNGVTRITRQNVFVSHIKSGYTRIPFAVYGECHELEYKILKVSTIIEKRTAPMTVSITFCTLFFYKKYIFYFFIAILCTPS